MDDCKNNYSVSDKSYSQTDKHLPDRPEKPHVLLPSKEIKHVSMFLSRGLSSSEDNVFIFSFHFAITNQFFYVILI